MWWSFHEGRISGAVGCFIDLILLYFVRSKFELVIVMPGLCQGAGFEDDSNEKNQNRDRGRIY